MSFQFQKGQMPVAQYQIPGIAQCSFQSCWQKCASHKESLNLCHFEVWLSLIFPNFCFQYCSYSVWLIVIVIGEKQKQDSKDWIFLISLIQVIQRISFTFTCLVAVIGRIGNITFLLYYAFWLDDNTLVWMVLQVQLQGMSCVFLVFSSGWEVLCINLPA